MATMNTFPPDAPKDWDEARDEVDSATSGLRAKAADMAGRASETVKDGYSRAKDALTETDPVEAAREGGEAVIRAVERHPLAAFGLGALSVGLIAWASLRGSQPASRFERYQPDYGRLRSLFQDYSSDAAQTGESALKSGGKLLRAYGDNAGDYADRAREYADYGSRMLAKRAEREPIAALLGIGIAVYFIGSLLTSSSEPAPARRRTAKR
ncbi:hypothetical protein [Bosea lathyri]|uniref:Uncharacterized protein n=1 Tax=Bosea lathyri TaxID=1036778 RepID=A0A1H6AXL4_9HYPH|nr:hypothetical protein [Bosea lathyri]SEG53321.1 hypothetical protein SAMN04488115_106224 [Bosea lathyri]